MNNTDPPQPNPLPDIAACLQAALDTLGRAERTDVDAWVGAVEDSHLARAIQASTCGTVLTREQVDLQYDRRVIELVRAGIYRDTIRDHLNTALHLIRAANR